MEARCGVDRETFDTVDEFMVHRAENPGHYRVPVEEYCERCGQFGHTATGVTFWSESENA